MLGVVQVDARFKPSGRCGCGCGREGLLRAKPWRDGVVCVKNGCTCKRCTGRRARGKGDSKARMVRQRLGLGGARTRHEEWWGGPVRTEIKADRRAERVRAIYDETRLQSEQARPIGDTRPFMASFAPEGTRHSYHVIRDDDLEAFVYAYADAWGFGS